MYKYHLFISSGEYSTFEATDMLATKGAQGWRVKHVIAWTDTEVRILMERFYHECDAPEISVRSDLTRPLWED